MSAITNGSSGDFSEALERCRAVAREEFPLAVEALQQAEALALSLVGHLSGLAESAQAAGVGAPVTTLKELEARMSEQGAAMLRRTRSALTSKRQRLDKFTIALFGQTMTGKSTFREAIMAGNGETIGQGAPNTTQVANEYPWNGLHIIDTPGFGAPDGRKFQQRAVRVVGQCDLVIFFVTDDNVPLEAREGMKEVLRENKKVFFVLNMKKGLKDEHDKRRFLECPERLFDSGKLRGHFERLRTLAHDWLGMRDEIRVFPIHAKAAHLATQAEDQKQRESLHTASRLEELHAAFREEVSRHGPIRRLQTLIDGTVGGLEPLRDLYLQQATRLRETAKFIAAKQRELSQNTKRFSSEQRDRLQHGITALLAPLREQVFGFVEDHIENDAMPERWQSRVRREKIEESFKKLLNTTAEAAKAVLSDFERELKLDAALIEDMDFASPSADESWDWRRIAGWSSALLGVAAAASVAFPPLAIGFGIAAAVSWGISLLFGNREKRLAKARNKARAQLYHQIDRQAEKLREKADDWLEETIIAGLFGEVATSLNHLQEGVCEAARLLSRSARRVDARIASLNRRLLFRTAELNGKDIEASAIYSIKRQRGSCTQIHCLPRSIPAGTLALLAECLGEKVSVIPKEPRRREVRKSQRKSPRNHPIP